MPYQYQTYREVRHLRRQSRGYFILGAFVLAFITVIPFGALTALAYFLNQANL